MAHLSALAVALTAFSMMIINVLVFVLLNHKVLTRMYSDGKRKKRIDELLNHAVNKIEIRNMIDRNIRKNDV